MTRGKKPEALIDDTECFAERMGYRWIDNPHPGPAFDFLIFKPQSALLVKVRQTRYRIDPESFYEDLFPDEIRDLRGLTFPPFLLRELRHRTCNERAWRRLIVRDFAVTGIEGW